MTNGLVARIVARTGSARVWKDRIIHPPSLGRLHIYAPSRGLEYATGLRKQVSTQRANNT